MRFLSSPVPFGLFLLCYSTNILQVSAGRFRLPRKHENAKRAMVNVPQLRTLAEYICPKSSKPVRRDITSVPIDQLQNVLIELQEMQESVIILISQYLIEGRLDSEDPSGVFIGTDGDQVVSIAALSSTTLATSFFSLSATSTASSPTSILSSGSSSSNAAGSSNQASAPAAAPSVTSAAAPSLPGADSQTSQSSGFYQTNQVTAPTTKSPQSASFTAQTSTLSSSTLSNTTSQNATSQTGSRNSSFPTTTGSSIPTNTSSILTSPTNSKTTMTNNTSIASPTNSTSLSSPTKNIAIPSMTSFPSSSSTNSNISMPTSTISGSGTSGPDPVGKYVFNAQSPRNVAVYYGQTAATGGTSLMAQCASPDIDIVVLAFVISNKDGGQYPEVNFGAACGGQTPEMMAEAPGLLSCPLLQGNITACQSRYGKKVMLSLGGAVSQIAFSSSTDASSFATTLWKLFGPPGQIDPGLRPFGTAEIDGFDVDNEDNIPTYWPDFASTMRSNFQASKSKTYYLSSAPQCPFPDASNPQALLLLCDFVFVQFYNNGGCQIGAGSGFTASVQQWSSFLTQSSMIVKPRLYIGAPAFPAAGSGAYATMGGPQGMQAVASSVEAMNLPNLGGAMFWDGPEGMLTQSGGKNIFGWAKAGFGQ